MAVGIWFQIWGAAEEKARRPKSVLALGTWRSDWLEERCKDKLCNRECSGPGNGCACAAQCHNCGKLDEKTCQCSCAKGWRGADCRARCEDTDKQCGASPGWPPRWCNDAKYSIVTEKCPAMCKLCAPDTDAKENACEPVYGPSADKSTPYLSTASSLSVTMEEAMMRMLMVMMIVVSISSNAALWDETVQTNTVAYYLRHMRHSAEHYCRQYIYKLWTLYISYR